MDEGLIEVVEHFPQLENTMPIIKRYTHEEFKKMYPEYKIPTTFKNSTNYL